MKCRHFHKILYEALQRNHRLMHQMYASSLSEYIDLTTRDPHITKGKMHILDGFIPLYTPPLRLKYKTSGQIYYLQFKRRLVHFFKAIRVQMIPFKYFLHTSQDERMT